MCSHWNQRLLDLASSSDSSSLPSGMPSPSMLAKEMYPSMALHCAAAWRALKGGEGGGVRGLVPLYELPFGDDIGL